MKVRTGESYYAEYSQFEVENEAVGYRLNVSGFNGTLSLILQVALRAIIMIMINGFEKAN